MKKMHWLLILILLAAPAWGQSIAILAGNLIDPATGNVTKNRLILVRDGKIAEIIANANPPKDAQMIDLSRSWVLPGLMDAHTHVTYGAKPGAGDKLEDSYLDESSSLRALYGLRTAQTLLRAGITTVRDVGNDANFAAVDLRRAINNGWFDGPTILTAGKIIAPFGGQSYGIPPEQGKFWLFEYIDADTPDEIRKAVRQDIYYGADVIKLAADNSPYYYSEDEIRAAVQESHNAGRAVAVHVIQDAPARNVINGGADSIEHGFHISDDTLKLMREKGTFLVGTDFPLQHLLVMSAAVGGEESARTLAASIQDRLHRAYVIGVKMAFGSDIIYDLANESRADMTWDYLAVWTRAGIPPAAIIKCMTTNAAALLRVERERGAISPGLAADIVATPEDPLANIEALRKINFVMKNGKLIRTPAPAAH
jgi:imidazolonepropionase-like amidohydrolase